MKIKKTLDYKLITALNKDVQNVHAALFPDFFKEFNTEDIEAFYQKVIAEPVYIFLVIEDEDQFHGYAWVEIRQSPENAFKKAYKSLFVHQISIVENKRGKGYGTLLMEEIQQIATQNGAKRIELDYWSQNLMAKSFYQRQGFTIFREFVYKDL